jgi:zinc protease
MALVGDPDFEKSYLQRIASVTTEDMRAAAARFFDPKRLHLAAMLPESRTLATPRDRASAAQKMLAQVEEGMNRGATKATSAKSRAASNKIIRRRLDNGMEVIIKRDPSVPLVAARAVWSGGQLRESEARSGISELMASVITRGCGQRSAEEIIEEVDASASTLAGFAGRNSFGIRAEWLAKDWQRGFDILADCLLSPRFEAAEVERAKRRQMARLASQVDSPSHRTFRLLHETLFRKHPYRRNALGTPNTLRGLDAEALKKHYRRHYGVSGLSLAIVGDIDPDALWTRIQSRFAGAKATNRPERKILQENFDGRSEKSRQVFATMDREQSHLAIAFPGIAINDSDRFAVEVLTTILGGQGGRLFVKLRDEQSLAYQIGAFSIEGMDPGYVAIYLSCAPEKVDQAVAALKEQIRAITSLGVSAEELARSQRYLIGTHEISLQRRASVASAMAFHQAYGLAFDDHLHYPKHIQKVKASDVKAVAQRIFDWSKAVTVTVGPPHASPSAERRMKGRVKKTPKRSRKKSGKKPGKKAGKKPGKRTPKGGSR